MAENYVSVSGISTFYDLKAIAEFCDKEKFTFPIAIGFQLSNKSINQGTANPKQPLFQHVKKLNDIACNYGLTPAFHYYTKDNSTIVGDLEKLLALNLSSSNEIFLQLNTLPPDIKTLEKIKQLGFKTIFKVPVSNLSAGGYAVWQGQGIQDFNFGDVVALVGQVYERKDFLDYVMFDPSHGIGLELDLSEKSLAVRFGKEILQKISGVGLVYAGGIGPENIFDVVKTLSRYLPKGFSIDTESKVRTSNVLDLGLVKKYLANAREAFKLL